MFLVPLKKKKKGKITDPCLIIFLVQVSKDCDSLFGNGATLEPIF